MIANQIDSLVSQTSRDRGIHERVELILPMVSPMVIVAGACGEPRMAPQLASTLPWKMAQYFEKVSPVQIPAKEEPHEVIGSVYMLRVTKETQNI